MPNQTWGTDSYGPVIKNFEQGRTPSFERTWFGTQASVEATASLLVGLGWKAKIQEGPIWQGSATYTGTLQGDGITPDTGSTATGSYQPVWEMHYNVTQKDLLYSGNFVPWVNYITAFQIDSLAKALDNPPENGNYPKLWLSGSNSTNVGYSQTVWKLAKRGFRQVPIINQVLRVQRILPFGSSLTSYGSNLFSYYHRSSLYTTIGIPDEYYGIMRQETDPSSSDTDGLAYYYGWMKLPPTIQDQTGNTILVAQDYAYGLYPYPIFGSRL